MHFETVHDGNTRTLAGRNPVSCGHVPGSNKAKAGKIVFCDQIELPYLNCATLTPKCLHRNQSSFALEPLVLHC